MGLLLLIGMTFVLGMVSGIACFIGICKLYWWLRDLKEPAKRKAMDKINKMYEKVGSL